MSKRWLSGCLCSNCGSNLMLQVENKTICFICEHEAQELKEAMEESEDFPCMIEAQGKQLGSVSQIIAFINTPPHVNETNLIDERYAEFISIIGICDEFEYMDMETLFTLARRMRNAKEKRRIKSKRTNARISTRAKTKANRLSVTA